MSRLILSLALCCIVAPAWALRCGSNIVSMGDSSLLLRKHCGEPAQIERYDQRVIERYDPWYDRYVIEAISDPYEIWLYNFGPRRLMARIKVQGGLVRSIETGGYGF
jgi:hypothetical protein